MVDSWYCRDRVVPEGMSQVSRQSEVGNHKRRSLNSRLSSGTSAGTFTCPAGPYRNCRGEAGTKNGPNWYFVPFKKGVRKLILTFRTWDLVDAILCAIRQSACNNGLLGSKRVDVYVSQARWQQLKNMSADALVGFIISFPKICIATFSAATKTS